MEKTYTSNVECWNCTESEFQKINENLKSGQLIDFDDFDKFRMVIKDYKDWSCIDSIQLTCNPTHWMHVFEDGHTGQRRYFYARDGIGVSECYEADELWSILPSNQKDMIR